MNQTITQLKIIDKWKIWPYLRPKTTVHIQWKIVVDIILNEYILCGYREIAQSDIWLNKAIKSDEQINRIIQSHFYSPKRFFSQKG